MKYKFNKGLGVAFAALLITSLACNIGTSAVTPTPVVIVVTATDSPAEATATETETSTPSPTATIHVVVVAPSPTPPLPTQTTSSGSGGSGGSGAQTAPADSDIVTSLNIKNDTKTFNGVISYPDGDMSDRIYINVSGFDASIGAGGNVTLTAVCSGTGAGNVKVTSVGNTTSGTPACNSTWVNFTGYDSNQITVRFYLDSGGSAYVNWTLIVSANN